MQFRQNGKNRRCGCMAILLREIFWWKTADFAESLILELWGLVIRPVIMQWPGLFDGQSRKYFLQGLDEGTVDRARGWALWKALITYHSSQASVAENAKYTINEIISENKESLQKKSRLELR